MWGSHVTRLITFNALDDDGTSIQSRAGLKGSETVQGRFKAEAERRTGYSQQDQIVCEWVERDQAATKQEILRLLTLAWSTAYPDKTLPRKVRERWYQLDVSGWPWELRTIIEDARSSTEIQPLGLENLRSLGIFLEKGDIIISAKSGVKAIHRFRLYAGGAPVEVVEASSSLPDPTPVNDEESKLDGEIRPTDQRIIDINSRLFRRYEKRAHEYSALTDVTKVPPALSSMYDFISFWAGSWSALSRRRKKGPLSLLPIRTRSRPRTHHSNKWRCFICPPKRSAGPPPSHSPFSPTSLGTVESFQRMSSRRCGARRVEESRVALSFHIIYVAFLGASRSVGSEENRRHFFFFFRRLVESSWVDSDRFVGEDGHSSLLYSHTPRLDRAHPVPTILLPSSSSFGIRRGIIISRRREHQRAILGVRRLG